MRWARAVGEPRGSPRVIGGVRGAAMPRAAMPRCGPRARRAMLRGAKLEAPVMTVEKLSSLVSRLFFVVAFLLMGLAVLEKILKVFGSSMNWIDPSRLLDFGTILMVFVMTLLLREIRDELRKK